MKFYIVTPVYNALEMLKLCIASVRDQAAGGVASCESGLKQKENLNLNAESVQDRLAEPIFVHHHVQDGGSSDGTCEYLAEYLSNCKQLSADGYTFSYESEQDNGMYQAINRGWDKSPDDTDLIAWLNCDEQYLSGTLEYVSDVFRTNLSIDFVFGDYLMVDDGGTLICYRKAHKPFWPFIISDHLYTLSCTMFLRKQVYDRGLRMDESFRDVADADFVGRALRSGFKARHCSRYFSSFAVGEQNMSMGENALREKQQLKEQAPWYVQKSAGLLKAVRLIMKAVKGCYRENTPLVYEIYSNENLEVRSRFQCDKPHWKATPFIGLG